MTYGEWLEAETRKECDRETIAKKLKRGRSPVWIHEEENFSMELIREVQACMESKEGEMYESIMEGPQGRNTAIEKVSEENTSLFNSMIKLETCRKDYTDAIRRDYARERITMKFRKGYTPSYIHKEDGYPIELILEVKKALEAAGEIVNEELELDWEPDVAEVIDWGDEKEKMESGEGQYMAGYEAGRMAEKRRIAAVLLSRYADKAFVADVTELSLDTVYEISRKEGIAELLLSLVEDGTLTAEKAAEKAVEKFGPLTEAERRRFMLPRAEDENDRHSGGGQDGSFQKGDS